MEAEQEQQEQPAARPRREKKSKFNNAALDDLASARGGGRKRTEQFQVCSDDSRACFEPPRLATMPDCISCTLPRAANVGPRGR